MVIVMKHWEKVSKQKLKTTKDQFKKIIDILEPFSLDKELEKEIINSDLSQLKSLLFQKKLTCTQLLKFFTRRAVKFGSKLNLLTGVLYDSALLLAKERETELESFKTEEDLPPLFGIPISLKDVLYIEGFDTSVGASTNCFVPEKQHGVLVEMILKAGGVPFVKTNLPQLLLINESNNWIWGRAKNPWDISRTTGGSSGGEAGLIAMRCSPLGFGTDGGGSVRIPSLYCGIYGFKPTCKRTTHKGFCDPEKWSPLNIYAVSGPLANSVDDCILMFRAMLDKELMEANETSKVFNPFLQCKVDKIINNPQLTIGYIKDIPQFPISKAQARAMKIALLKLREAGHKIVEFDFQKLKIIIESYLITVLATHHLRVCQVKGEKIIPEFLLVHITSYLPIPILKILGFVMSLLGQKRLSEILVLRKNLSCSEYLGLVDRQTKVTEEFFQQYRQMKLDCLLTPGMALPANHHGDSKTLAYSSIYTLIYNILDLPTGAIPITLVKEDEQTYEDKSHGENDKITEFSKKCMENSTGIPLGIQVSTLPHQDEKCLGMMKILEKVVGFKERPEPFPGLF